jgi:type IV pilus assembly protein PilX
MNMMNGALVHRPCRQRGAALLTGLIFLVILTLLGITAARMAGLEERMSGNMRDRALAMQAAEMALRDAEQDIIGVGNTRAQPINGLTNFVAACTNGLCYNGPSGNANGTNWTATPIWTLVSMTAAPSVAYAAYTSGAAPINGVSAAPRYIIEGMMKYCWKQCEASPSPGYRITVRAQGANPNTVVWLQEVFKP